MVKREIDINLLDEAVRYARGSNNLETNVSSEVFSDEIQKIIDSIKNGDTDESLLWLISKILREQGDKNGKKR